MEMQDLMAQAKQLQDKVAAAQALLDKTTIKGMAGDGAVIITITGKYDPVDITIAPGTPDAVVLEALRDAKAKADVIIDKVMGEATAGMPMPE